MFDIGNVFKLNPAAEQEKGSEEQVVQERRHCCAGVSRRVPFYPQPQTCTFVTCRTWSLRDFVTGKSDTALTVKEVRIHLWLSLLLVFQDTNDQWLNMVPREKESEMFRLSRAWFRYELKCVLPLTQIYWSLFHSAKFSSFLFAILRNSSSVRRPSPFWKQNL